MRKYFKNGNVGKWLGFVLECWVCGFLLKVFFL